VKGLGSFIGERDRVSILSVQDPGEETKSGYNQSKAISVWAGCNRNIVDVRQYMEFVRVAKPDLVVALCDGDTPPGAPHKRITKAAKKSLDFLDTFLELKTESPELAVLGAVQGGRDTQLRKLSAVETSKRNVDGFLLDGFHSNGPAAETLEWDAIKESFLETIFHLPVDKPRFYFGPAPPDLILELVSAGVDVFDTSYPNLVTDRDAFLMFNNKFSKDGSGDEDNSTAVANDECRAKFEQTFDSDEMRLAMRPLVEGCTCYTCRNFTVAYLHHLVHVKEMLGKVLLSLHNLHHYFTFFNALRQAIREDQVQAFKRQVLKSS
jgi:queuine tRNA-ribosyltransferase subunit QTRTD1